MAHVGVLALQGAVIEHLAHLPRHGCEGIPVKKPQDLKGLDALIIPGGESTAISRLIRKSGLTEALRDFGRKKPVLGICAGLILCASDIADGGGDVQPLELMDISVCRNGFGRQIDSFETELEVSGTGRDIPAVFIRAPYIVRAGRGVKTLAFTDGRAVMAESGHILVCAFHPELTEDPRVFARFFRKLGATGGCQPGR
jgi:5'-phosphate synthase pdxT subunit